jgi:hypothetical protein
MSDSSAVGRPRLTALSCVQPPEMPKSRFTRLIPNELQGNGFVLLFFMGPSFLGFFFGAQGLVDVQFGGVA